MDLTIIIVLYVIKIYNNKRDFKVFYSENDIVLCIQFNIQ